MIHLYAAPGLFPATLCGLDRVWGSLHAAVYGKDIRLVNCPECLAKVKQTAALPPEVELGRFQVGVVLWALALIIGLLWVVLS